MKVISKGCCLVLPLLFQVFLIAGFLSACAADRIENSPRARGGRQDDSVVSGGIDFSGCVADPETGLCCVDKEETLTSL